MKLKAYAKINLTLDVVRRRDDGYHDIDSVMQSVSLYDTVSVKCGADISVRFKNSDIDSQNNTAFAAARKFFDYTKICGGALIEIEKRIPQRAGLGGGSADAAAVIIALDRLYETSLTQRQLIEIGLKVGADVPFCIVGGTARVGGIGEKIAKLPLWDCECLLLVKRSEKRSTGQMYSLVDSQGTVTDYTERAVKALESGKKDEVLQSFGNTFLPCYTQGDLLELKRQNALAVSLSGSGPTYFCVYNDSSLAALDAQAIKKSGFEVYDAKSVGCGTEIVMCE